MKELFYEESSTIQNVSGERKKYQLFHIISVVSYIFFGIFLLITFFTFDLSIFSTGLLSVVISLLINLLPLIFLFLLAFYFGKLKNKYYNEYDYTIVSGSIRISKVIMNKKRKFLLKFEASQIERIGFYDSPEFNNYIVRKDIKKMILTSNSEPADNKKFFYMLVFDKGERKLLIIECTETFIINLLNYANRSVMEKVVK